MFQKTKSFLKEELNKNLSSFNYEGISYDLDLETHTNKAETYLLEDSDSFVSLIFTVTADQNGNFSEMVRSNVVVENEKATTILDIRYDILSQSFIVDVGEVIEEPAHTVWETIKERNYSGLIEQLKEKDGSIETQAFGDFCLPGGYQYCGQACGTNGSAGGGGPIYNKIDGCCYIHDDCYRRNKTNRCSACDLDLISCVNTWNNFKEGPVAATAITTFFNAKCNSIII
ncbi:hypothetical protein [Ornithinibacillus scapharcae]|uniref:hypothetical protein n=1 Tax=Ornithinibacillus scapharcae TaxID=1147159 RepID=UPI0002EBF361|nr:hypothetical protein [Ornithinibacillus scapharcae]